MDARTRASASIARAQSELDRAIGEIESIHTLDPAVIGLVAHALDNYVTVTAATIEMLQVVLRDYEDADVAIWLRGIGHATDLMLHSVGRLAALAPPREFQLTLDRVDLPVLLQRACEYYRRHDTANQHRILCATFGDPPLAWGDRVAIAVVAENLLSNAVRVTPPRGVIRVTIASEPGHIVVTVRDEGPGLTSDEQRQILRILETGAIATSDPARRLGLVIASEFVQRMDGALWCESAPGQGATFSFRLPAAD
jgi:signal transduction histidine kinase